MTTFCLRPALALLVSFLTFGLTPCRAQDMLIYDDALQASWSDWSWASTVNWASTATVHSGSKAVSVTITNEWGAFSVFHNPFDSTPYTALRFWINGGPTGGQRLQVAGLIGNPGTTLGTTNLPLLAANTWQQFTISLATLGVNNQSTFTRFWIQDQSGGAQPVFYLDDITLLANPVTPPAITLNAPADGAVYNTPATINCSATVTTNGHTINKVGFYNGSTLLAEDTTPPYTFTWNSVAAGNYSLFARVTYDSTTTRDSAAANVMVVSNTPVTITVDAQLNRHPICPLIYGSAFTAGNLMADLNFTLNRSGGNAETRANWALNAHNHARDWYYESLDDFNSGDPRAGTPAATADAFIADNKSNGAEPVVTIPMIGWMPKLGSNRGKLASYSIQKYGPQTDSDYRWMPDAGNGLSSTNNNQPITWNNPNDANFPTNSAFQQAFLTHLTNRWGVATNGGVRFYCMDNEHTLWHQTHQDVHPGGASRQEIRDRFFDYASRVKAADPNAQVLAPEEYGWSGYFNSGADLQYGGTYGWSYLPDRATNGNLDYVCWLLNEFHKRDTNTNQRLLDYFTLHRYTEDSNVGGDDVSTATQLKRNRWTRSFWDTNYVDESWIGYQSVNIVMLIPRMKNWVATYYPGTKIGITEYNWGAEKHINGATTQADILGIFGREGVDLATRWWTYTPDPSLPVYQAMKIYRNYDGNKSTFGDVSVSATGPNPDSVSVFAAVRSADNALTIMVINKQLGAAALPTINLANFAPAGTAQVWQLTSANTITRLGDLTLTGNTITNTLPAQSITLYVVPAVAQAGPATTPSPVNGATGVVLSPNLSWTPGANATAHRLYFGTSSNTLATATTNAPEFKGSLASATYAPGPLASSGRFYWRVDEMLGTTASPGPVWTFATMVVPTDRVQAGAMLANATNFVVSFPSQIGQTYRVERTDSLNPASWISVADNLPGTGAPLQVSDPVLPGQPQRFYRILTLAP